MITQSPARVVASGWQQALAEAVRDPDELLSLLGLSGELAFIDRERIKNFPLRVPRSYVAKMRYQDRNDPLLRQVFPAIEEGIDQAGFGIDPVGDHQAVTSPGLLQKYHGRALLLMTGACAIHCRYCFRRHFPYNDSNPLASKWPQTLSALQADRSISEVILSGGDPLSLTDNRLAQAVKDLGAIPHLQRLRIHTRLPVVLPERINDELLSWIENSRLQVVMVIHANHANEIDPLAEKAVNHLQQAGCTLLNQTVLLAGINDSASAMSQLSERLFDAGILPYYLHLLDKVQGAGHFDVDESRAIELIAQMRRQLPGYLVPRLVREEAGEPAKTIIA